MKKENIELLRQSEYPGVFILRSNVLEPVKNDIGLPWRVRNRLLLHKLGLCGMFTALVEPGKDLGEDQLKLIIDKATEVNEEIGLPTPLEGLIIRTRDVNSSPRMSGSNPLLMVGNVDSVKPDCVSMDRAGIMKKHESIQDWMKSFNLKQYLMIHEDNLPLQREIVHGRIMRNRIDGSWELLLGMGILNTRQIGSGDSKFVGMGGHDLDWLIENVLVGDWQRRVLSYSSSDDALRLVNGIHGYEDDLRDAVEKIENVIGPNVVLEFRVYLNEKAGLQIYDFDSKYF